MPLRVLPDAELLVVGYLRGIDELANLYVDIHARIPRLPTPPLIRVLRVGGTPVIRQHLDVARLQVDCWADGDYGKETAHTIARLAQAALHDLPGAHDEGVVTAVEDGVFRWAPDDDTGWAGYQAEYLIYLHPNPADGGE